MRGVQDNSFKRRTPAIAVTLLLVLGTGLAVTSSASAALQSNPGLQGPEDIDWGPSWVDELVEGRALDVALDQLASEFPDVFNSLSVDYDADRVIVHYDASSPDTAVVEFLAAVEGIRPSGHPTIIARAESFSRSQAQAVVQRIFDERDEWSALFGSPMSSVYVDDAGVVRVTVDEAVAESAARLTAEIDGVPIVFDAKPASTETLGPQPFRSTDASPWTAGLRVSLSME